MNQYLVRSGEMSRIVGYDGIDLREAAIKAIRQEASSDRSATLEEKTTVYSGPDAAYSATDFLTAAICANDRISVIVVANSKPGTFFQKIVAAVRAFVRDWRAESAHDSTRRALKRINQLEEELEKVRIERNKLYHEKHGEPFTRLVPDKDGWLVPATKKASPSGA